MRIAQLLAGAALSALAFAGHAAEPLRVCSSTQDAPFSTSARDGFENRIAEVLARETGRDLQHVWIDKPAIYLVHLGVDQGICDVVIGVDAGDTRLLSSKPYYRTGYVFVSRHDRDFEGARWQDADTPGFTRFSYRFHSPAETILKYTGRYEDNLAYTYGLIDFKSRRNQYINVPAERVIEEVVGREADLAIAFAPEVARYVRDSADPLRMTMISNEIERSDGVIIPLQYNQAVGVAKEKPGLLAEINAALESGAAEIRAILEAEGVPLLPAGS
ncbi:methanol oxidation system protein MoxJ [Rubrimonas cliftonensis]|uniref:Amino acid ABC transporter substrate-binding protein, PAAT family n=1 Tax=Rubrimonas cliftonensis TaxID=89524 RepID=A0A1H4FGY4_9RHOB|nr:methanol oxidation system protein MoxJ [Rubrimonas cliftonensis]SEA96535.1 amino acid ABC transporter substrate-binding protein, PAAT family [Rubrimonas cliftonensis]